MKLKFVAEADKYKPAYANETDACMDLKACLKGAAFTYIDAGEMKKIGTGIKVAIPEGHVMQMFVRSSTGIRKNLILANCTGIIDAGYREEIIMALYNTGKEPVKICDGDRLCQFIILPFPKIELEQVNDDENFREGDRGGGIGSTGK